MSHRFMNRCILRGGGGGGLVLQHSLSQRNAYEKESPPVAPTTPSAIDFILACNPKHAYKMRFKLCSNVFLGSDETNIYIFLDARRCFAPS